MRKPCCFFTVCLLFQREIQTLACGHVVLKFLSRQHNLLRPTTMTILKGVPSILPPDLLFALARMVGLAWVGVGWRRLVPLLRVSFLLPLPPPLCFPISSCALRFTHSRCSVDWRQGHGDELVLADANFPAESVGASTPCTVVRCDALGIPELLAAILKVTLLLEPLAHLLGSTRMC